MRISKTRWLLSGALLLLVVAGWSSTARADGSSQQQLPQLNPQWAHTLSVTGPGGVALSKSFEPGAQPVFQAIAEDGTPLADGQYRFELNAVPEIDPEIRKQALQARQEGDLAAVERLTAEGKLPSEPLMISGTFSVVKGVIAGGEQREQVEKDEVIYDDLIVDGSLCVGNDCYSGLAFGFDTIVLMENNLRIYFDDTSTTSSFPRNDWRIVVNDTTDGGGAYFAVQDATGGLTPFTIEAGAKSNSLYVDDDGQVGIGTSGPVFELHIKEGDTPAVRLHQSTAYGWPEQIWDVGGNETSFFVRDGTHAARLPFRIEPETPTSTLCLKSDGKVGIGTWSPGSQLEIEDSGQVFLTLDNTLHSSWSFSSANDSSFRISDYDETANTEFSLDGAGNLTLTGTLTVRDGFANEHTYPDYVFAPDYQLMPLNDLDAYIREHQHLPKVPAAETLLRNGLNMTEMQIMLLEKVEELTLYTLDQQKAVDQVEELTRLTQTQQQIIEELQTRLAALESMAE